MLGQCQLALCPSMADTVRRRSSTAGQWECPLGRGTEMGGVGEEQARLGGGASSGFHSWILRSCVGLDSLTQGCSSLQQQNSQLRLK